MKIIIELPEKDFASAFANVYHRQDKIAGEKEGEQIANPQSKDDFLIEKLESFCEEVYIADIANQKNTEKQAELEVVKEDYKVEVAALSEVSIK